MKFNNKRPIYKQIKTLINRSNLQQQNHHKRNTILGARTSKPTAFEGDFLQPFGTLSGPSSIDRPPWIIDRLRVRNQTIYGTIRSLCDRGARQSPRCGSIYAKCSFQCRPVFLNFEIYTHFYVYGSERYAPCFS